MSLLNDIVYPLYLGINWVAVSIIAIGNAVYCSEDNPCPALSRLPSNTPQTYLHILVIRVWSNILPFLFHIGALVLEVYIAALPSLRFDQVVADVDVAAVTAYGELRDWVIVSDNEKDHRGRVARLTQLQSYVDAMKHKDIAARHAFQVCGIPINCLFFSRLLRAMLAVFFVVLVPAIVIMVLSLL